MLANVQPKAHVLLLLLSLHGAAALQISATRPTPNRLISIQLLADKPADSTSGPSPTAREKDLVASSGDPKPPSVWLLMTVAALQSGCFGCIGTALPPALRASGLDPSSVALLLGRLGSASALCEVLLSNSFGKLSDAIGRKPIMLAAPAITVLARSMVVLSPTLPVLIGARLMTTLVVPVYWLAYQAAMADSFGGNTTKLAVVGSRVQAGMGLGYALASLVGGPLAQRDIRYAYAASCSLGCCVLACIAFGFRETLSPERRVRFEWKGGSPLGFQNLFKRGALAAKLNLVVVCQVGVRKPSSEGPSKPRACVWRRWDASQRSIPRSSKMTSFAHFSPLSYRACLLTSLTNLPRLSARHRSR